MEKFEALKRSRRLVRVAFTKAQNRLTEMMAVEKVDTIELESELNVFRSKAERLEVIHLNVLELLTESEYETEYEGVDDFRSEAIRIETRTRWILDGHQNVNTIIGSSQGNSIGDPEGSVIVKRSSRLPKLELGKLNGDAKESLYFRGQFEEIHVDSGIEDSDKFQYLLQATGEGSRVREVMENFPPTGGNYPKATDCLKSRFGHHFGELPEKEDVAMMAASMLVKKGSISDLSGREVLEISDPVQEKSRMENVCLFVSSYHRQFEFFGSLLA